MRKLLLLPILLVLLAGCNKPELKSEADVLQIFLFPNPATERVSVHVNSEGQAYTLQIFDPDAKLVAEHRVESGSSVSDIGLDLEGKPRGVYHVVLEIGGRVVTDKFYKV